LKDKEKIGQVKREISILGGENMYAQIGFVVNTPILYVVLKSVVDTIKNI